MGTWSVKIFGDDLAMDIKDNYREAIIMGATEEEADQRIIRQHQEGMEGMPETFWLPLAITEWKIGRLSDYVKEQALKTIQEELEDLPSLWEPSQVKPREKELLKAREQLLSPQPERKKLRMPWYAWKCPWPVGSVLQYRITWPRENNDLYQNYVLMLVVGISETPSGKVPLEMVAVKLYNWYGKEPPTKELLSSAAEMTTIPIVMYNGQEKDSISFMGDKKEIREKEIKLFSLTPLGNEAVERVPVTSFYGVGFDNVICNSIVHQFPDDHLVFQWR